MAISKKNSWTTFTEAPIADFAIEFHSGLDVNKILEIVENVLLLSNRYEICMIDIEGDNLEYLDYLKFTWDHRGYIYPYYLPGYKYYSNDFRRPFTKLLFYKNGSIIAEFVSELCKMNYEVGTISLVKEHGRGLFRFDNYIPKYGEMVSPITLSMAKVMKGQEKVSFWSISGSIKSDIWLEKVSSLKILNKDNLVCQIKETDNQELAYFNVPRLNSFLRGLKNIAKSYGGNWFFEFETSIENRIKNLYGQNEPSLLPLNGKIIYQEDIDDGRVKPMIF